jgi:ribonuclease III
MTMDSTIPTTGNDALGAGADSVDTGKGRIETGIDASIAPTKPTASEDDPSAMSVKSTGKPKPWDSPAAYVPAVVDDQIALCSEIIGYEFKDPDKLVEALNAARFGVAVIYKGVAHNLRRNKFLAIRGDAVIEANLACKFEEIENLVKGRYQSKCNKQNSDMLTIIIEDWTAIRKAVTNEALDIIGRKVGIDKCMNIPPGAKPSLTMVATAVEAVMGAVHKDGGEKALDAAMKKVGITHEKLAALENQADES